MKVKISYTADLERIPDELTLLFENIFITSRAFAHQAETTDTLLSDGEIEAALALMNKMRSTMVEMDTRLADLSSIAEGYLAYNNQGDNHESSNRRSTMGSPSDNAVQGPKQPNGSKV